MSNIDKRALREAADAANKSSWGRWESYHPHKGARGYEVKVGVKAVAQHCLKVDSVFIAAANPATVLALLDELEAAEKRISELESDNAYIKNRHKELDLLIGKNILVMQAAIIEWQGTGDARKGLAWIYNTLFGPGELPDESEKDAQAYFYRKYAHLDEELMNLHRWFWEQSEAERAAAAGKGE
ncbi:ead/Ea22-like family protein [Enterobacter kobei]|uniref:ead/Ea22-like family protein n=1 Tax=Enterobacter kobei TaxID=208224 RepID=UPI001C63C66F|nr:ead/Ea22-like family protein [Enterobacter kobei]MBW7626403.1 ead/Ea22-like family protein [Enterobacter kobei]